MTMMTMTTTTTVMTGGSGAMVYKWLNHRDYNGNDKNGKGDKEDYDNNNNGKITLSTRCRILNSSIAGIYTTRFC